MVSKALPCIALLALLLPLPAAAQTNVEANFGTIGAAFECSETLDQSTPTSISQGSSFDFDSPDTSECWGNRSGAASFTPGTGAAGMVAVSTWGNADYALKGTTGITGWARVPFNMITSATRTLCTRFYMEVDDIYGGSVCQGGGGLQGRNKLFQFYFTNLIQGEERANGGCAGSPNFNPLGYYSDLFSPVYPVFSNDVDLNDCDQEPCRFEMCLDGDILAGTNIQVRARYTSLEPGGPEGLATSSVVTNAGAPFGIDTWGGDWFKQSNSGMPASPGQTNRRGYFRVAGWNSDTNQWIGAAPEIESGGGGPPAAPHLKSTGAIILKGFKTN